MYLDGKFALRKDIWAIRRERAIMKLYMKTGKTSIRAKGITF